MSKYQVRNSFDALIYLADCSAATVETLVYQKRVAYSEISRHVNITIAAIYFAEQFVGISNDKARHQTMLVKKRLNDAIKQYNSANPTRKNIDFISVISPIPFLK